MPQEKLTKSFTDREISRSGHLIHKLKAKDSTRKWAYYFVLIDEPRERDFMKMIGSEGMIDLKNFGTVVASCYGEKPDAQTANFLKETYGFDV